MNTDSSQTISHLSTLHPGKIPLDIFTSIARLVVTPVVEIVPFFNNKETVLLFQKKEDDAWWPSRYYVPGTILLAHESQFAIEKALERIVLKMSLTESLHPTFVGTTMSSTPRGVELALVYSVILIIKPPEAQLFRIDSLPAPLIEDHDNFIQMALTAE